MAEKRATMLGLSAMVVLATTVPATALAQDQTAAAQQFKQACAACHTAEKGGAVRPGPNLWGVFGREAGKVPDFRYSNALKDGGFVWDEATLDAWLTDAKKSHPGTTMDYRQRDAAKRRQMIDYLKSLSDES